MWWSLDGGTLQCLMYCVLGWHGYIDAVCGLYPCKQGGCKTWLSLVCAQVQTIAFLSHLRHKGIYGPFLVLGPLSTLPNWVNEFQRWFPDQPVQLYHGSKPERAELRKKWKGAPSPMSFCLACLLTCLHTASVTVF